MTLVSDLLVRALVTETVAADLQTNSAPLEYSKRIRLATGVAAAQADLLFTDTRTLAASGTEDLDLKGSLLTPLGVAFTPAKLKAIIIAAASGNTNDVNVSRPASNGVPLFAAAGDLIPVKPGGVFVWIAPGLSGVTVTAGTGDLITVTNSSSGTGVTYDVVMIGTSS